MDKEIFISFKKHLDKIYKAKRKFKEDGQIFKSEIGKISRIIVSDFENYIDFYSLCLKALESAKKGNIIYGEKLLNKALGYINQCNQKEGKFFSLWFLPIKGYFSYKKGDYSKAIDFIVQTMELDDVFEPLNSGVFYHKIQQIQNIARVEAKRNLIESALAYNKIYRTLILKEKVQYKGVTLDVNPHLKTEKHIMLQQIMFRNAFAENISNLDRIENETNQKEYFFRSFDFYINAPQEIKKDELYYWVHSKKNILERNEIDKNLLMNYFKNSTEFSSTFPAESLLKSVRKYSLKKAGTEMLTSAF